MTPFSAPMKHTQAFYTVRDFSPALTSLCILTTHFVDPNDSQSTKSRLEALPDGEDKRRVLGGTKAGNGAWAVAWVDTIMEYKAEDPSKPPRTTRMLLLP